MPKLVSLPSLQPLRSRNVQLVALLAALLYYVLEVYLFNRVLVNQTITGDFDLGYKLSLFSQLILGHLTMFPLSQIIFMLLTTIFVGINLALLISLMQAVKQSGSMKVSFGGVSLLALVSTGCPSCGLTVLSFLGPSTAPAALFLHDWRIQSIILLLLTGSIIFNLKKLHRGLYCVVPSDHAPRKISKAK